MPFNRIKELATLATGANTTLIPIYLLATTDTPLTQQSVGRIGGKPIGVTSENWPSFRGSPMEHLITIDLNDMPALKTETLTNARAVALFISNRLDNEAFQPNTKETKVIALTQDDINNGELADGLFNSTDEGRCYRIVSVNVPLILFDDEQEIADDSPLSELRDALFSTACFAAGKPFWIQFEEHHGHFLFQFDDTFINTNLGDAGVMYVFVDAAFWQCY